MTERSAGKPGKAAPRLSLDGVEWKAAIAAWLGVIYLVSWFAIRGAEAADPASPKALSAPSDDGISSNPQSVSQAARPAASPSRARPAAARPGRIRTRSS